MTLRARAYARLLLLALVLGLLPAAAPVTAAAAPVRPAAVPQFFQFTSNPVTVKDNKGVRYQMVVSATDASGMPGTAGKMASITLSKSKGKRPRIATQTHTFNFDLSSHGSLKFAKNLSKATVSTGKAMGGYGAMKLTFAKSAGTKVTCRSGGKAHEKSRAGKLKGTMKFKTGTKRFGTIKAVPRGATATWSDFLCDQGGAVAGCTTAGSSVGGWRDKDRFSLSGSRTAGAKNATIGAFWMHGAGRKAKGNSNVFHSITAVVPAKRVKVAGDLSKGVITGHKGTWLSGKATFAPAAPASDGPWVPCGKGKEERNLFRFGTMRGNLKVTSWFGKSKSLGQGAMDATTQVSQVRARQ